MRIDLEQTARVMALVALLAAAPAARGQELEPISMQELCDRIKESSSDKNHGCRITKDLDTSINSLSIENCSITDRFDFNQKDCMMPPFSSIGFSARNCSFIGGIAGDGLVFVYPISFVNCEIASATSFKKSIFMNKVIFKNIKFGRAAASTNKVLPGDVPFAVSELIEGVIFENALFSGAADFSNSVFNADVSFAASNFIGKAKFNNVQFNGADFSSANFWNENESKGPDELGTSFRGASFSSYANFSRARFSRADFSMIQCGDSARLDFAGTEFARQVSFESARINALTSLQGAFIGKCERSEDEDKCQPWDIGYFKVGTEVLSFEKTYSFSNLLFAEGASYGRFIYGAYFPVHYRVIALGIYVGVLAVLSILLCYLVVSRRFTSGGRVRDGGDYLWYFFLRVAAVLVLYLIVNFYVWVSLRWIDFKYFYPVTMVELVVVGVIFWRLGLSRFRLHYPPAPSRVGLEAGDYDLSAIYEIQARLPFAHRGQAQILRSIDAVQSATFGLAGRRGIGKSFLALRIVKEAAGYFGIAFSAPTSYDEKDFLRQVFSVSCDKVLVEIAGRPGVEEKFPRVRSFQFGIPAVPLYLILELGFSVVAAVAIGLTMSPQNAHMDIIPFLALIAIIFLRTLYILLRNDKERNFEKNFAGDEEYGKLGAVYFEALKSLEILNYQRSQEESSGFEASRWGLAWSRSFSVSRAEREMSFVQLVERYKGFMSQAAAALGKKIVVVIDEVDKIEAADQAKALLNRIKGVFQTHGVIYLITLSEDIIESFRLRHLTGLDPLDSSFDDVFYLEPLSAREGLEFLKPRLVRFQHPMLLRLELDEPERFEGLLFTLSILGGGVPRDLLRLARRLTRDPACDLATFLDRELEETRLGVIQSINGADLSAEKKSLTLHVIESINRGRVLDPGQDRELDQMLDSHRADLDYLALKVIYHFRKRKGLVEFLRRRHEAPLRPLDPDPLAEIVSNPHLSWANCRTRLGLG